MSKSEDKVIRGVGEEADDEWSEPSLAVIACRGGQGCVLWYGGGPSLAWEIEEYGCEALEDLGLDTAPPGISSWTGIYIVTSGDRYDEEGGAETTPIGEFRALTDEEWKAVIENRSPWPEAKKGE